MTTAIGFIKPACDRHTPTQVLDRIGFSKPCDSNTSPEFKGIKTIGDVAQLFQQIIQIPALNSKGLRQRCQRLLKHGMIQIPALNSKGLRRKFRLHVVTSIYSNTSPEFKGIKTSKLTRSALGILIQIPALNSKGLRLVALECCYHQNAFKYQP